MSRISSVITIVTLVIFLSGGVAAAQMQPKRTAYPIAIIVKEKNVSVRKQLEKLLEFHLTVSGWFRTEVPTPSQSSSQSAPISDIYNNTYNPADWQNTSYHGVLVVRPIVTTGFTGLRFTLYEVEKGETPIIDVTQKTPNHLRRQAIQKFVETMTVKMTRESGILGSKIAFVRKASRGHQIRTMNFDGTEVRNLTSDATLHLLPAWSPSGYWLAYTSYAKRNPDLWVTSTKSSKNKPRRSVRISSQKGMNTGASWSPDGSQFAITLSKDGNPNIYIIRADNGSIVRQLTKSRAIDTSPAWSPDGKKIAFVSDRQGNPQIFIVSANGGRAARVSFNGNYNSAPTWSPRKDESVLAYTTRIDGKFDIVTLNVRTQTMTRITQNQGTNEEPSFSPNGRAIAFVSRRKTGSGIYVTPATGSGPQFLIYRGKIGSLDWSSVP